jgi:hypothetical protein
MVVAAADVKKKYDVAYTQVLATTTFLEEQCAATILTGEACTAAAMIEPPSPTLTPTTAGRVARSDDDYEAIVIANIHVHATDVQNIHCLISVALDLSSIDYAQWHNNVVLTLGYYSLSPVMCS